MTEATVTKLKNTPKDPTGAARQARFKQRRKQAKQQAPKQPAKQTDSSAVTTPVTRRRYRPLNVIAVATAVGLVTFSGAISAWGLMRFVPGAEFVIVVMAVLFEASKLVGFAMVHRPAPRLLKGALLTVGLLLMTLNVAGVSGFLSNAYMQSRITARAIEHTSEATAHAEASLLERQLAQAEGAVAQARTALVRARDDKGRVKAAQAILTASTADRDVLVAKLSAAQTTTAKVEGSAISATGEFAAVVFMASMFNVDQDTVAKILIAVISALPDVLAALLILTVGYVGVRNGRP
jgi:hypothetical protein